MANKLLGDAGTIKLINNFGLAFQYEIKKIMEKNGQKQSQIKNILYNLNA